MPGSTTRSNLDHHFMPHWMVVALAVVMLTLLCAGEAPGQGDRQVPVTDSTIALGAQLFRGSANCVECHGASGQGTDVGPDLTDEIWLHGSGTYETIVEQVTHGVTRVESTSGTPMPMRGWAPLNDDQVAAVAAYVWSLRIQAANE